MKKIIDLTGLIFGKLKVIKNIGKNKYGKYKWLCKCACGMEIVVLGEHLRSGNTKSCGCLAIKIRSKNGKLNRKHGHWINNKASKTYKAWRGMFDRCNNINNKYYGGRNPPITVCDRWDKSKGGSFENFLEDMGKCPGKGYSIDRTNNDLGYFKENCRWATRKQQNRNLRSNIIIPFNGNNITLIEYCEIKNLNYSTMKNRITTLKWPIEKALTTPIRKRKNK